MLLEIILSPEERLRHVFHLANHKNQLIETNKETFFNKMSATKSLNINQQQKTGSFETF